MNVGIGREVAVRAGAVCGWGVVGAGVPVAGVPHATTPTINVANARPRTDLIARLIGAPKSWRESGTGPKDSSAMRLQGTKQMQAV